MLYRITSKAKRPELRPPEVVVCACTECGAVMTMADVLSAPNPFDPTELVQGCPACKSIDSMSRVCEVIGCQQDATCGLPLKSGRYVQACGRHYSVLDFWDHEDRREPDC